MNKELRRFIELIENTIDLAATETHEYLIKSTFDSFLQEIEHQRNAIQSQMTMEFEKVNP